MGRAGICCLLLIAGCGAPGLSVELSFPDEASRAETNLMRITAVEPFFAGASAKRTLLECGQLSVFAPYAVVNRQAADLPALRVLENRRSEPFPFRAPWSLSLQGIPTTMASNPWGATMVHFEAQQGESPHTILEGCFCFRQTDAPEGVDAELDQAVHASCPRIDGFPEEKASVALHAVVRPDFRLSACGPTEVTATDASLSVLGTRLCLAPERACPPGERCPNCTDSSCAHAAILLRLEAADGTSTLPERVIYTDQAGTAAPELEIADCQSPPALSAEILGRPDTRIAFSIRCAPPIDLPAAASAETALGLRTALVGLTVIPGVVDASGQALSPARIAALYTAAGSATLEVFAFGTGGLSSVARRSWAETLAHAARGYHQRRGPLPSDQTEPRLAIVTSSASAKGRPRVNVFELVGASGAARLVPLASTDDARSHPRAEAFCPVFGCVSGVCQGDPCRSPIDLTIGKTTLIDADLNGDGQSDLLLANSHQSQLVGFYSPTGPALLERCRCFGLGASFQDLVALELGGEARAVQPDLVMSGLNTAFVRYASQPSLDGPGCDALHACAGGLDCWSPCGEVGAEMSGAGRCLQRCQRGSSGACSNSPLATTCTATTPSLPTGYCASLGYDCSLPQGLGGLLFTTTAVGKRRSNRAGLEDAVLVGSQEQRPFVHILRGGPEDIRGPEGDNIIRLWARPTTATTAAPSSPRALAVGDLNGDRQDDLAVLYSSPPELRVWLGSANTVPGELGRAKGVDTSRVRLGRARGASCQPLEALVAADLDGDGRGELITACVSDTEGAVLQVFRPEPRAAP